MQANFYCYYVTTEGDVYNTNTDRKLKPNYVRGYLRYTLYYEGERHGWQAHRLVAKTYIPNPEHKPCVNHKDGDKHNNKVDNLEWVTYSENESHSYDQLGKVNSQRGERSHLAIMTEEKVRELRKLPRPCTLGLLHELSVAHGVSVHCMRDIMFNRSWKHVI